ncbi:UDP-glucosyltransferase 2-like [Metopolophium dirhodum]|uniref:UDP-glucosyltransferase 2-like n=1 Tax=Metopolophium dirhodum TaxID=44670 RepID=UPI002990640C|nr:UDP-glucosyltransferase 2-like [Metopolophium dirhodum]XP_060865468.1 UDP-glucosyltransferase 2-like [Metopolophium dirhodum]XP_060865469.1 UDP-glucosyltransferase 2-like [Metopolophium dirhodum]
MSSFSVLLIALCVWPALLQWTPVGAANILAVQSIAGKSHWNVMRAVLRALTDRGHTVTVFTPFMDGDRPGYTEVDVSEKALMLLAKDTTFLIENFGTMRKTIPNMVNFTRMSCNMIYGDQRMVDILDGATARKFDMFITEPVVSECVAYAANLLGVPMVYVIPFPIVTFLERPLTGHSPNPASTGHMLSSRGTPKTFNERFINAVLTVYCSALKWYIERQFRLADHQPYDSVDLVKPSLIFSNTHFIIEPARSLTPDVVQIGGIHLEAPKPIPKDILEFIDDAPHGVICFSFGSMVLMSSLPENIQSAFRKALARVPQKVLWKYEGEMKDKPKNVMTRKWIPQRDILLHPKVKLFISHGGILGVYEAVDAGVPVLGFPIYNDQPRNIDNLVDAGMAISMNLLSVTEDTFLNAVLEIINEKRYQKNAKIASERFKDRPMSSADLVVYWTEYVLRHNGAPNLKSHAMNLAWYQYFLIDVIITLLFIAFVILFIIYYVLKMICKHIKKYFYNLKAKRE